MSNDICVAFQYVVIIAGVLCTTALVPIFSVYPVSAQNPSISDSSSGNTSRNQYIVLADLRIIQAIHDLLSDNSSGHHLNLSIAQAQLDQALGPQVGEEGAQEDEDEGEQEETGLSVSLIDSGLYSYIHASSRPKI